MTSKFYHWNKKTRTFEEGFPEPNITRYGDAPFIITDSMERFYHHGACTWVDSRSKLKMIDQACGTITSDRKLSPDPTAMQERERARREDASAAIRKAKAALDVGASPLTEEQRARCKAMDEQIKSVTGWDGQVFKKKKLRGKRK